ncbi:MAG: MBL fold metallo-hydrolase [Bacteroidales bacterium]|nr:MBL fold metallo-hydrolase [Bacteroidales bacterium]
MEIEFLGTGTSQGVPIIGCKCPVCNSLDFRDKRMRSSIFIKVNNKNFIIDTGPDFRSQLLRAKVDKLDAVLITHPHRDHLSGLDDIRAFNFIQDKVMPVYANSNTIEQINKEFYYCFKEPKYPGVPNIKLFTVGDQPFYFDDVKIIPIKALHYKMPILGFRINNFTYLTDASFLEESEINKIIGSDVFVINALRKKEHLSHFTLAQALDIIKIVNPKQAYLTHIGHQMGFHSQVQDSLPKNVYLAFDGLKLNF